LNTNDITNSQQELSPIIRGNVLLVGYGIENRSVYSFLKRVFPDIEIAIADQKAPRDLPTGATTYFGKDYLNAAANYETLVRAPGVPPTQLPKNKNIITATQIFFALNKKPTIGITGTKGKSTTSALIFHLLKTAGIQAQLLGNIGTPILEGINTNAEISVIELSSFHLEDLRVSPNIAVLLAIAPEHLDHHGSTTAYIEAKLNIARHQKDTDKLVIHSSHRGQKELGGASSKIFFDLTPQTSSHYSSSGSTIIENSTQEPLISINNTKLVGEGNVQNIIAALEVAKFFDIPKTTLKQGLLTFSPLPHRLEPVGEFKGVHFYNDSLCTVPEALRNAINAFGEQVQTVIVGGYDRGISFIEAGRAIAHSAVENVIYFPTTGEKILQHTLEHTSRPIVSVRVTSMKEAVLAAYNLTAKGRICLLSPASPSFSVFKDYADRGDQFKSWVTSLSRG
jgi:UDP-N-acetylmuramoylalanine--D-glutamate ligase